MVSGSWDSGAELVVIGVNVFNHLDTLAYTDTPHIQTNTNEQEQFNCMFTGSTKYGLQSENLLMFSPISVQFLNIPLSTVSLHADNLFTQQN